ncbi:MULTISPECIES: ATP-dependent endonuclease [Cryobacterium]|uniref:ATP-dependent endonuclease n=1 Tax=Cryobacterium glucosi TaxID=1259175 RepID=A0ABY2ISI4_9MICO|nr:MULTISPECIES: AAA family ATPase [Cryobacterium]TFB96680.1 ATP-dependent endonuclease [Cryobacterium sp. MDB2-A-1]TFC12964.1 ATP-dependent endonuclease [Cryobacterium sp. MDB2-A-2]TFC22681.1 ATP-dependent endonuclease [Cryobacterium glucosi]TFC23975.1 ATP-dependent endonuclease [Cryobacterium sp. MDB2-10]
MIEKLVIENFLQFESLAFDLDPELNILVGNNDAGKSTVIQALEMVLAGRIGGRSLEPELSPFWFTQSAVENYLSGIIAGNQVEPPTIVIEVYFRDDAALARLKGKNNSLARDVPGIRLEVSLDRAYSAEYAAYISEPTAVKSVPIEFYRVDRRDFAGESVVGTRALVTAVVIDASTLRLQSGTDYYLRKSISQNLTPEARAKLSLAFRSHREGLLSDPAFVAANAQLGSERTTLSKKSLALSTDSSARASWESGIIPHLDGIPFSQIGQGEQSAFKILLALEKSASDRNVVMIEEPENHLSHSNLNTLIGLIRERSVGQQLVLTTHSSFVLNKLGVEKLRLISNGTVGVLNGLEADTQSYFLRLSGYDTLRMVLARAVILVEGPSDELVVQKAYVQKYGCMPLEDGVDVMSVQALAFKRFLALGQALGCKIAVVTDLDDDASDAKARKRFEAFERDGVVRGFVGQAPNGRTLEPQLVAAAGRDLLNAVFKTDFDTDDLLQNYMTAEKTEAALAVFSYADTIPMPNYIDEAIAFVK